MRRDAMISAASSALALLATSSANYRSVRPITTKNIGRNWLKQGGKYMPHQGKQECERRANRAAMLDLYGNRNDRARCLGGRAKIAA